MQQLVYEAEQNPQGGTRCLEPAHRVGVEDGNGTGNGGNGAAMCQVGRDEHRLDLGGAIENTVSDVGEPGREGDLGQPRARIEGTTSDVSEDGWYSVDPQLRSGRP